MNCGIFAASKIFIDFAAKGRLCIRFGMVSMETDVEELLALVVNTGSQIDEQVLPN